MPFWLTAVIVVGIALAFAVQYTAKHFILKWRIPPQYTASSGKEFAEILLQEVAIDDLKVEWSEKSFSDRFSPLKRTIYLSPPNYHQLTVATLFTVSHEVAHGIQEKEGYLYMRIREKMAPHMMKCLLLTFIFFLTGAFFSPVYTLLGTLSYLPISLFYLITVPIEYNASFRARELLLRLGTLTPEEKRGANQMLHSAGLVYLLVAGVSLIIAAGGLLKALFSLM